MSKFDNNFTRIPEDVREKLNKILNDMPENLNTIEEKARYFHLSLCNECAYDEIYRYLLLGNQGGKSEEVYRLSENGYCRIENGHIVGICNSFAYLLGYLFEKAQISCDLCKDISEEDFPNREI